MDMPDCFKPQPYRRPVWFVNAALWCRFVGHKYGLVNKDEPGHLFHVCDRCGEIEILRGPFTETCGNKDRRPTSWREIG